MYARRFSHRRKFTRRRFPARSSAKKIVRRVFRRRFNNRVRRIARGTEQTFKCVDANVDGTTDTIMLFNSSQSSAGGTVYDCWAVKCITRDVQSFGNTSGRLGDWKTFQGINGTRYYISGVSLKFTVSGSDPTTTPPTIFSYPQEVRIIVVSGPQQAQATLAGNGWIQQDDISAYNNRLMQSTTDDPAVAQYVAASIGTIDKNKWKHVHYDKTFKIKPTVSGMSDFRNIKCWIPIKKNFKIRPADALNNAYGTTDDLYCYIMAYEPTEVNKSENGATISIFPSCTVYFKNA